MFFDDEPHGVFFLIDNKSFYDSCEAVARGLNPLKVPLVVLSEAGNTNGGLILAMSPKAKCLFQFEYNKRRCAGFFTVDTAPFVIFKLWSPLKFPNFIFYSSHPETTTLPTICPLSTKLCAFRRLVAFKGERECVRVHFNWPLSRKYAIFSKISCWVCISFV